MYNCSTKYINNVNECCQRFHSIFQTQEIASLICVWMSQITVFIVFLSLETINQEIFKAAEQKLHG